MLNFENFAITLARAVEVFRSRRDSVNDQKGALRALVALTKLGGATVRLRDRTLSVESAIIPATLPGIRSLIAQMDLLAIAEIRIARDATAADLLELVRSLAEGLGGANDGGVSERLAASHATSVRVLTAQPEIAPRGGRAASVTDAFETAGLIEEAEAVVAEATETDAPGSPLDRAIEDLALDPLGADVLARLNGAAELIERRVAAGNGELAVRAVGHLVRIEAGLPDGSARRSFAVALKRICTPRLLHAAVAMLQPGDPGAIPAAVLRRAGSDAAPFLLDRLASAESMADRRAAFDVLRDMPDGVHQAVRLLSHAEWYVVRNVAELAGELRFEDAVPALGQALEHQDARVRKAAAVALGRIGTAATVEHLRQALRKGDSEVRGLVAGSVGGRESGALAMPLVLAAEAEPDPDVQREFYLALARIGTPAAIQALVKAAQPGGRFFRRRRPEARLAAIVGLRAAGGPAAVGTLESLRDDPNRQVRQAARAALEDLGES